MILLFSTSNTKARRVLVALLLQLKVEHAFLFFSFWDGSEMYMQPEHTFRSENDFVVALFAHILF